MKPFTKGDKVVILDHDNKTLVGDKGIISVISSKDDILVYIDQKFVTVTVKEMQIMHYTDIVQMAKEMGCSEEELNDWGSRDIPDIPEEAISKCVCSTNQIMWGGCICDEGKFELKREQNEN